MRLLVAFEGVEGSGKTTLSVEFCRYLNERWERKDELCGSDFVWTKEPDFSIEEAHRLNSDTSVTQEEREARFLVSRIRHQSFVQKRNIVCDRYIWSALVYTRMHSPDQVPFLEKVYLNGTVFKQPDLYVLVNTDIADCCRRYPHLNQEQLLELWKGYEQTQDTIRSTRVPVIEVTGANPGAATDEDSIAETMSVLVAKFRKHMELVTSDAK